MGVQGYPDPGGGVRLPPNETPGGCSPRVLEAIARLGATDLSAYPSYADLVLDCAHHFGVDPDWILVTNGLDEGILMAALGHIARARRHGPGAIVPLPAVGPSLSAPARA